MFSKCTIVGRLSVEGHRAGLLLILALLLSGAALLAGAASARGEDWPQWRGPRGDGSFNLPRFSERWPKEGLSRRWSAPVDGGYSGLAVADGRVVIQDYVKGDRESERVACFALESGDLLWEHRYDVKYEKLDYGFGPRATPTVHDGRVYTLGAVGHVCCLDVKSGRLVWTRDLLGEGRATLPGWGLAGSPVVWGKLVILHPGAQPGGCFLALDRATGEEAWRAGDDPAGYATPIVVKRGSSELLVGWTPEHIVGLAPASGELLWKTPYKVTYGVSIATPVFHAGRVLVCGYWEGSKSIALGEGPGEATLAWEENKFLRGLMSPPLVRQEHGYLLDKGHGLVCFRLKDGEKLWDDGHQLTERGRNPHASLVWLNGGPLALALNAEGDLVLLKLSPERCEELARSHVIDPTESNRIWSHPAFTGQFVVVRSDRELVCVELPTKK